MSDFLSTGQIAKYCGVHLRTVIRWIERGHLKGYKLPGRGNNRVEKRTFINFLIANEMPIPEELLSQKSSVLVIDDDVAMAKAIMRVFHSDTWETAYAADGFQAGLAIANGQFDLITLDLMMPGIDGFSVLSTLKNDIKLNKIPVLVISGCDEKMLAEAKQSGASETLGKPFENKELIEIARKLIGIHLTFKKYASNQALT